MDQNGTRLAALSLSGSFAGAKLVMDFGFYKRIPEQHLEHLKKLNLPELKTEHLAFQIVDHSLGIKQGSLSVASDNSQIMTESFKSTLTKHLEAEIPKAI